MLKVVSLVCSEGRIIQNWDRSQLAPESVLGHHTYHLFKGYVVLRSSSSKLCKLFPETVLGSTFSFENRAWLWDSVMLSWEGSCLLPHEPQVLLRLFGPQSHSQPSTLAAMRHTLQTNMTSSWRLMLEGRTLQSEEFNTWMT